MISIRTGFALAAASAVAAVVPLAGASPAGAVVEGPFATIYALTDGPCAAQVDASVSGNGYPDHAAFTVSTNMVGVGDMGACSLPVTLNWRNLTTGQSGAFTTVARGPGYWSNGGYSAIFAPGIGNFTGNVTVGNAYAPESGGVDFTVKKYRP
ncbi:hypothetical protein OG225_03950 [Nocardia sp. NBC_01377]|uniref:hypothetical protein n=1 Tax=Nocardia TaxID=1817 RepID=UPI001C235DB5|nr:hypothetical protein [Nocardia noduli]